MVDFGTKDSDLKKFYDLEEMLKFVSDSLEVFPLYTWADPLGKNPYSVMHTNHYFPWHFDGNEFTLSALDGEGTRINPKDGNKTFCMAPWTHTYVSPQMERRLCCASREDSQNFTQYLLSSNIRYIISYKCGISKIHILQISNVDKKVVNIV